MKKMQFLSHAGPISSAQWPPVAASVGAGLPHPCRVGPCWCMMLYVLSAYGLFFSGERVLGFHRTLTGISDLKQVKKTPLPSSIL